MVRGCVRPATREPTRQVPFSRTLAFSWYVAHVSWFPGVRKSVFLHFLVYRHGTAKNVAKSVFVHFAVLGPGTLIFSVAWPWCVAASVRPPGSRLGKSRSRVLWPSPGMWTLCLDRLTHVQCREVHFRPLSETMVCAHVRPTTRMPYR